MVDCIIIGAGMAGLTAARKLQDGGHEVIVLEKSRGTGGRMATRRFGGGTHDTGAQFISARSDEFQKFIQECTKSGSAKIWADGFPKDNIPPEHSHPRYCGSPGMTAIAKQLARNIEIKFQTHLQTIHEPGDNDFWVVEDKEGDQLKGRSLLLTPPAPQTLEILNPILPTLKSSGVDQLKKITYHCCICIIASLDKKSSVPKPGGIHLSNSDLNWVADNQQKGISATPSITLHSSPGFSLKNYDQSDEELISKLVNTARPIIGDATILEAQVRRWRYSMPSTFADEAVVKLFDQPAMFAAGEAMVGGKVEGAFQSGSAAAEQLKSLL